MIKYRTFDSPIGPMLAAEHKGKLCQLGYVQQWNPSDLLRSLKKYYRCEAVNEITSVLKETRRQISLYFDGKLKKFHLPLDFAGSPFQKSVWKSIMKIPYGKTASYGWVASQIFMPQAPRAVGGATGANRIALIVPCHRVIGRNGDLVGYGGDMWLKIWLLRHEGVLPRAAHFVDGKLAPCDSPTSRAIAKLSLIDD